MLDDFIFSKTFREKDEPIIAYTKKDRIDKLKWKRIPYVSAKAKFKFIIYRNTIGNKYIYRIGNRPPGLEWTKIDGLPSDKKCIFEEAVSKEYKYLWMIVNDIYDKKLIYRVKK